MRRLLAVLALFASFGVADAKTLIVGGTTKAGDATYGVADAAVAQSRVSLLARIFDTFGASYVIIPIEAMRTEWARSGRVTWDVGTSAARNETFDAVIHTNFTNSSTTRDYATKYRPESLTVVAKLPVVPNLFIGSPDARFAFNNDAPVFSATTSCSTGVAASVGYEGAGEGSGTHDEEGVYYQHAGITDAFCGTSNVGRQRTSAASAAGKGYRALLKHGSGPIGKNSYESAVVWSSQWDSTGRSPAADTCQVWMVQNTHAAGKKPNIYAWVSDGFTDNGGGLSGLFEKVDVTTLMIALAALDSASGGRVFDNQAKTPLTVALTVDGLCSRASTTHSWGIVPTDTSRFYGTLDSLARLDVPVTFGVNIDSVATYARDLQYAKARVPRARFTPQGRSGLDSAAAGNGIAQRYQPRDAFRRYRNALVAVGPATAADTSLYALLRYAILKGDSLWGLARSSRFALPPDDDWSPYNLRADQAGPTVDSVLYAYRKAGFRGIRINGAWDVGRPNLNRSNPRGYIPENGAVTIRYGTDERGDRFRLLAHNGSSTMGSLAMYPAAIDSAAVPSNNEPSLPFRAQERFWYGLLGYSGFNESPDGENATGEAQRCRIFRMSAQELAGPSANTWKHTQRPGWWAIRQVVMPIRMINRLAGRSLIQLTYPEDVEP